MPALYELIYTSTLADTTHLTCVADIVRTARNYNGMHAITGVLIFDGANFCQYLEGPQTTVLQLVARIAADTRHVNFDIRHHCTFNSQRRFAIWNMAYALDDNGAVMEKLLSMRGPEISTSFIQSIPHLDMEFAPRQ